MYSIQNPAFSLQVLTSLQVVTSLQVLTSYKRPFLPHCRELTTGWRSVKQTFTSCMRDKSPGKSYLSTSTHQSFSLISISTKIHKNRLQNSGEEKRPSALTCLPSQTRTQRRSGNRKTIIDPSDLGHDLLELLPSSRLYTSLCIKTNGYKNSFFPQAITFMNSQATYPSSVALLPHIITQYLIVENKPLYF